MPTMKAFLLKALKSKYSLVPKTQNRKKGNSPFIYMIGKFMIGPTFLKVYNSNDFFYKL